LFSCTEREALNLGIFLKEIFFQVNAWKVDKALYAEEAGGKIGFNQTVGSVDGVKIPYEMFTRAFAKWHARFAKVST
jgi:THO complex subunit 2